MKLYELAIEYREIVQELESDDSLDEQTIKDTLDGVSGDLEHKVLSIARVILEMKATSEARAEAAERMAARAESAAKKAEWLQHYLRTAMEATGLKKAEDAEVIASLKRRPPALHMVNKDLTPPPYWRHYDPPPPKPDRRAILKDLKAGKTVEGWKLRGLAYRLEIK